MFTRYMSGQFSLNLYKILNFEVFHCGVECLISTFLGNRFSFLNSRALVEESIRYLIFLEIHHRKEIIHQHISVMGLTYVGGKQQN